MFPISCRIPGNDTSNVAECIIKDSICDLCLHFIASSLCKQNYEYSDSRWQFRGSLIDFTWHQRAIFLHYSSLRMLETSARTGCELCSKMLELSNSSDNDRMVLGQKLARGFRNDDPQLYSDHEAPGHWLRFSIFPLGQFLDKTKTEDDLQFEFVLAEDAEDCLEMPSDWDDSLIHSPSPHSKSQECFTQITEWYQDCCKHDRCRRDGNLSLPRRLLALFSDGQEDSQISLVQSKNLRDPSHEIGYVALSYCWGEGQEFLARDDNMDDLQKGINLKDLPAVIQDAVYICRRCKIGYLWGKHLISSLPIPERSLKGSLFGLEFLQWLLLYVVSWLTTG